MMRRSRGLVLALSYAVFFLAACGGGATSSGDAQSPDEKAPSNDIEAALERELEPLEKHDVASSNQGWKATIEATAAPRVTREDGSVRLEADLGVGTDLDCWVYDETIDAGATVTTVLAAVSESVQLQRVLPYSFQVLGHEPALFVRAIYTADVDGEKALGDLKLVVSPRMSHSFLCSLDTAGYTETFVRVTSEFGRSFRSQSAEPTYKRHQVWKMALGELPIGYAISKTLPEQTGNMVTISQSALLWPVSEQELSTRDEVTVVKHDSRGVVLGGTWIGNENAKAAMEIELSGQPGAYQFAGNFRGKPVSGAVTAKKLFAGEIPVMALAKRAVTGEAKPLILSEYHPSLDPARATEVTYTATAGDEGAKVTGKVGKTKLEFETDGNGVIRRMTTHMAGTTLSGDLVYEKGAL